MAEQPLQEAKSRFDQLRAHLRAGDPWIDPMAYELIDEIERETVEVVPRSEAEALAEALEAVNLVNPPAALAAFRSRHPKAERAAGETP